MREIDRRNLDSKAKRSSIHYSIEKNTLNLLDNANGHDDDSSTKLSKDENLPQDDVTKQNIKSEIVRQGVRKKLPPISRHAHSFNEFDHKRLSRQTSEQSDKSGSGSQTSLRDGARRRFSSGGDKSMFTLKSKPHRESVGIVSHVTGDLSVKLTKVKPLGLRGLHEGGFNMEEYLSQDYMPQIPNTEKGTRKLRPLSTDIRVVRTNQLRRTKSSTPAMVLFSIKPDMSPYLPKQKSIGNLLDSRSHMHRNSFQRAVMAVTASNRITRATKIWRV